MTNAQELIKRRKAPLTARSDFRSQALHDMTRPQQFQANPVEHQVAVTSLSTNEKTVATRQMKKHTFVLVHGA
jgi:hypothetical protein